MEGHKPHIVDYATQAKVWAALVVLTLVTVATAEVDFAMLTVAVALTIASVKSVLVLLYFMHLKFESRILNIFVIVVMLVFLAMIVFTFFDYIFRLSHGS
ncbi:MAG: cytochrome c oxidase subunit [Bacteroidales bacterium]|jgi:cytochrome c oxidase subunit 4|nr:cytochrome c oxidase subunit [Bacteroidales bacterium]MDN5330331.1 cytochrome c oxidase subunit [Bacteroidales bacterium]